MAYSPTRGPARTAIAVLLGALCAATGTPALARPAPVPAPALGAPAAPVPASPTPAAPSPTSRADLARQLSQASEELEVVIEQYNALAVRLADTQARIATATAAAQPLRQATEAVQARLNTAAASLYRRAGGDAAALISAGTTETLVERLTTLDHLAYLWHTQLDELLRVKAGYDTQRAHLDTLAATQRAEQAALGTKKAAVEQRIASLRTLRQRYYGTTAVRPPARDNFVPAYQAGPAGQAVRFAYAQIGKPYQYGSAGPRSYDCSGLVMASWHAGGVDLPHNSAMMWHAVPHIGQSELQPGDLVFYYRDIHHVAIYIGGGRIIHAPTYGQSVEIAPVNEAPVYGYGRPR